MRALTFFFATVFALAAQGAIKNELIEYKDGDLVLEGYIAYDDASTEKRPGVLIVHSWTGVNKQSKATADELAKLGYVGFALDMYGKGVYLADPKDSAAKSGEMKANVPVLRQRALAGLEVLRKFRLTDPGKLAAIGYCFGGTTALEIARSGEPIQGVVSFHGALGTKTPEDAKNIKCKVLALHGAIDPAVPAEEVAAFEKEMRDANVNWELVSYGGAVHSFTDPDANRPPVSLYHEQSAKRSWIRMQQFFDEIFE
ncbi:MAG TPA: dienelactone hydrolase family protein [Candidatus Hydrogenedentes bacterium]|nr:dienelactone hydrolase family protein [Candidatus Hydrogenedentota bacterium]HRK35107.1 dienelactone hydrolase family protein [Candidatus Hydrogenedentota bacterium]